MMSPPQAPAFGPLSGMPARLNLGLQAMWIARIVLLRRPKLWTFGMSTFLLWNGLHLFDWVVLFCFFKVHPACFLYGVCIAESYICFLDAVTLGRVQGYQSSMSWWSCIDSILGCL